LGALSEAARVRAEVAEMKVAPLTIKPMNGKVEVDYSKAALDPVTAQMSIVSAPELTAPDWLAKSEAQWAAEDTWIKNVAAQTGMALVAAQNRGPRPQIIPFGNSVGKPATIDNSGEPTSMADLRSKQKALRNETNWVSNQTSAWLAKEVTITALTGGLGELRIGGKLAQALGRWRPMISGDASVLISKVRLARGTGAAAIAARGELNAARALQLEGQSVHFAAAAGDLGVQGVRTADLLVGGARGTGLGGIAYEVYTPLTANVDNIVRYARGKVAQADRLVINLDATRATATQLSGLMTRVQSLQEVVFVRGGSVIARQVR
jgi:hypothetical protein